MDQIDSEMKEKEKFIQDQIRQIQELHKNYNY